MYQKSALFTFTSGYIKHALCMMQLVNVVIYDQDLEAIKYTFKLKENHLISKFYEENTLYIDK